MKNWRFWRQTHTSNHRLLDVLSTRTQPRAATARLRGATGGGADRGAQVGGLTFRSISLLEDMETIGK